MERRRPRLASKRECTGCLVCEDSCSHQALRHYIDRDGHIYVRIIDDSCVGCLKCEKTCPIVSGLKYGGDQSSAFYAAWNKNDADRERSASGGAFSAIARYVLEHSGAVIGAATESICEVKHIVITDVQDLWTVQGSKYTQSDVSGIYRQAHTLLKDGVTVLFSGTGCQVGGLLCYLRNKQYRGKLITMDLICGGVPSKLLLRKFIEHEPFETKKILSYRTKEHGWKPSGWVYNLKVEDAEGRVHDYTGMKNLVTTGFCSELTERGSCYNCRFVGRHRLSDFTIGDLWGDAKYPEEHTKGLSLVIAHNQGSKNLLNNLSNYLHTAPCDEEKAANDNPRLENGRSVKQYALERIYLEELFTTCSYKTLKKIYANDYKNFSFWIILKIIRKIFLVIFQR